MANLSIIESASVVRCCDVASTSSASDDHIDGIDDADECCVGDNNNKTSTAATKDGGTSFPKRASINISFKNLKYTVKKLNFSSRRFGKYLASTISICLYFFATTCSVCTCARPIAFNPLAVDGLMFISE